MSALLRVYLLVAAALVLAVACARMASAQAAVTLPELDFRALWAADRAACNDQLDRIRSVPAVQCDRMTRTPDTPAGGAKVFAVSANGCRWITVPEAPISAGLAAGVVLLAMRRRGSGKGPAPT